MKTSLFDFDLPEERIATRPLTPRESAKMLHVGGDGISDSTIADLPSFLRDGDVMVFNDTRVIPARLFGKRGEARVELLLHHHLDNQQWQAFARPAKRLRVGETIIFAEGFQAEIEEKRDGGEIVLHFPYSEVEFRDLLEVHGRIPLPPYIERQRQADATDREDYQTVFAREEGSVAAPTAGLHFTSALLETIRNKGVKMANVTLHVGAGTFLPVKVEETSEHVMHAEWAELSAENAALINRCKEQGGRIIAVGSTSLRTLESAADEDGIVHPYCAETAIFITPGYRFRAVDVMFTNFHLPRSTLFMLVSAFCGLERMQTAYAHAIENNYRFYSYGDACLLYRAA